MSSIDIFVVFVVVIVFLYFAKVLLHKGKVMKYEDKIIDKELCRGSKK
jgi:hypothetical protein